MFCACQAEAAGAGVNAIVSTQLVNAHATVSESLTAVPSAGVTVVPVIVTVADPFMTSVEAAVAVAAPSLSHPLNSAERLAMS